jgi:hypothetical protein
MAGEIDFTALFTAGLTAVTGGLWWATRQLVIGAEKSSVRELAAYVSVSPNSMAFTAEQPLDIHAQSIRLSFDCKNHGQTPARNLRFRYEVQVLPNPLPLRFQFPEPTIPSDSNFAVFQGGQSTQQFIRKQPLTSDELANISLDEARIYCWGVATYRDIFDRDRYVEFNAAIVSSRFFVSYLREFLAHVAAAQEYRLPTGMKSAFDWDFGDRHGHGD